MAKEKKQPKKRRKTEEERKEKYISCRVNNFEYELIKRLQKEKKIKVYDLIYYALHNITIDDKNKLNKELIKIGTNINQIAKNANITKNIDKKDIDKLIKLLLSIQRKIYNL